MGTELKPETLRKKQLAAETLPQFLARMTLVWEDRQRRLAEAPARAVEAARRYVSKVDPETFKARRRAAVARYEAKHPERVKAARSRLSAALAVAKAIKRAEVQAQKAADRERKAAERGAKRINRPEGYPKVQAKPHRGPDAAHVAAVARQPDLSRAWFGSAPVDAARPEERSSLVPE